MGKKWVIAEFVGLVGQQRKGIFITFLKITE
jgi:hypothetical protein